jgi:hypothetical protein
MHAVSMETVKGRVYRKFITLPKELLWAAVHSTTEISPVAVIVGRAHIYLEEIFLHLEGPYYFNIYNFVRQYL